jgi:site-specific DNA-methyltransferase (adenine-specific)
MGMYDAVFSNPPYQASVEKEGDVAPAIYHNIVKLAIGLGPRYVCMIIPSRWMTGGQGEGPVGP